MITGFNTDIEHNGVVYHVQTEDKGLETPLILSLVYTGGEILASKRAPYEDLIAAGFDEEMLAQRLKRQHRLICAAINAGRIEDLKRMSGRGEERATPKPVSPPPVAGAPVIQKLKPKRVAAPPVASEPVIERSEPIPVAEPEPSDIRSLLVSNADDYATVLESQPPPSPEPGPAATPEEVVTEPSGSDPQPLPSAYTVHDSRRQSPLGERPKAEQGVVVTILDEVEYRAGQTYNIRVFVEKRSGKTEKPLGSVQLSVKILGTTFRPQLYSVKTGRDGVAVIAAQIPRFTSGRAAILIRAEAEGKAVETRRVIYAAL